MCKSRIRFAVGSISQEQGFGRRFCGYEYANYVFTYQYGINSAFSTCSNAIIYAFAGKTDRIVAYFRFPILMIKNWKGYEKPGRPVYNLICFTAIWSAGGCFE